MIKCHSTHTHCSLAKRAIIATQTKVQDGTTYVEVIDATNAETIAFTTVTKTVTATETDATYICKYSLGRSACIDVFGTE